MTEPLLPLPKSQYAFQDPEGEQPDIPAFSAKQMHAYVLADRAARAPSILDDFSPTDIAILRHALMASRASSPAAPAIAPLSDEQIDDIWAGCSDDDGVDIHELARAIERAHGIGA